MGRFGVPIFVESREPTRKFDVGFRVLEIATAIAEVRFEVSPILRLARSSEFFYAGAQAFTQSRIVDVRAIHCDDRHLFRQTFVDVQIEKWGNELAPGEITVAAENYQGARVGGS